MTRSPVRNVRLARKIRRQLKITPYKMAQKLERTIQSYQRLERLTTNCALKDLVALHDIAIEELGWSSEDFIEELRRELKPANGEK